jgi:hypothetical protein
VSGEIRHDRELRNPTRHARFPEWSTIKKDEPFTMHYIHPDNAPLLKLEESHPARRVLAAHVECRDRCVGQELGLNGSKVIEQKWYSRIDQRTWTFSGFAYMYLSFTCNTSAV